jgi:hypothetical protein
MKPHHLLRPTAGLALPPLLTLASASLQAQTASEIGLERSIPRHLQDGEEFTVSLQALVEHGKKLFAANWTVQEGAGRPLTKGTGNPLADPSDPLVFPRNFNRVSAPDANSCAGCHNLPVVGGNGDLVANVFVLGQRFDFALFDGNLMPTKSHGDEAGSLPTIEEMSNNRATLGMQGSGYIEMLAREMTVDLQAVRDALGPGESAPLVSKGVDFGTLARNADGTFDVSGVTGLPAPSLAMPAGAPPGLLIRPFHQPGNVVSLRQFTNNAMNHHHGIQTTERFGSGTDPDGDSYQDEMTVADTTACTIFQATMAVPGRVIPDDPQVRNAILVGEQRFVEWGCAQCHTPALPLSATGHLFTEPNPFNPPGNLQPTPGNILTVDLNEGEGLPEPRLKADSTGTTWVPAFTDLRLHDITSGPDDPNRESIDMNQPAGSPGFFAGNSKFLTRKLWGAYGKPNFFHHGKFTTMREAVLAHDGEALAAREAFEAAPAAERDFVIEFLKTLQMLPEGTEATVVDQDYQPVVWPPNEILGLTVDGDSLEIVWQGSTGIYPYSRTCQLEVSDDLVTWLPLGDPTTFNIATIGITEAGRYFRVRLLE